MKFAIVILCIALQVLLGSAVDVAPKQNIATELGEIQATAQQLHEEIENYLAVYRSTLSEINAENGVSVAMGKLQDEMDRIYMREVETRLEIWTGTSGDCLDDLYTQLDTAFEIAGDDLSVCSILMEGEVYDASLPLFDKINEVQTDSTYLQFAALFGITVHNVFTRPAYTVDELSYKVETFRRIWEEEISVEFSSKLSNYRERFAIINSAWNVCLLEAGDKFDAEAARLIGEIELCPAKKV